MLRYLKPGLFTFAFVIVAIAPSMGSDQVTLAEIQSRRQAIVVKSMEFKSDKDKEAFLKIYVPYQEAWMKMVEERASLIESYAQSQKVEAMKDQAAKNLLQHALVLDSEHAWMLSRYLAQLEKILPIQKVVRAYQIENRIDAIVAVNAAKNIPLAR
jgi:hypothetical protein